VQGDRTVGITEPPAEARPARHRLWHYLAAQHGHNAVEALTAMREGRSKVLIALGGNLAVAMPDPEACFAAVRSLDLSVNILTKFNRTCLLTAKETLVLPCLGRTELDLQAAGPQWVTVEDSMSMVRLARGSWRRPVRWCAPNRPSWPALPRRACPTPPSTGTALSAIMT
jgi:anaerobic selenocysteine-containing dehydrogenase